MGPCCGVFVRPGIVSVEMELLRLTESSESLVNDDSLLTIASRLDSLDRAA